jgi:hypothetical protein
MSSVEKFEVQDAAVVAGKAAKLNAVGFFELGFLGVKV